MAVRTRTPFSDGKALSMAAGAPGGGAEAFIFFAAA
jgi:hypothetical protein